MNDYLSGERYYLDSQSVSLSGVGAVSSQGSKVCVLTLARAQETG